MRPALILLFSLLLPGIVTADIDPYPAPFEAEYEVHLGGFRVGSLTRSLRTEGDHYVMEQRADATGFAGLFIRGEAVERSEWVLRGNQAYALRYHYRFENDDSGTEQLSFDWRDRVVHSLYKDRIRELPLEEGTFDRLMAQIELRRDLMAGRHALSYQVAERRRIKVYDFAVVGRETLDTALGPLETLKVRYGDDGTHFWCAVDYDYLLVRLQIPQGRRMAVSNITQFRNL